jgi:hypothetical protein
MRITRTGGGRRAPGGDDRRPLDAGQRPVGGDQLARDRVQDLEPADEVGGLPVRESGADHPPLADCGIGQPAVSGIRHKSCLS